MANSSTMPITNKQHFSNSVDHWGKSVEQLLRTLRFQLDLQSNSTRQATLAKRIDRVVRCTQDLQKRTDVYGQEALPLSERTTILRTAGLVTTCFGVVDWLAAPLQAQNLLDPHEWDRQRKTWLQCLPKSVQGRAGVECLDAPYFHAPGCGGPQKLSPPDRGHRILAAYQLYAFNAYLGRGTGLFGFLTVSRIRAIINQLLVKLVDDGPGWLGFGYGGFNAGMDLMEDVLRTKSFDLREHFKGPISIDNKEVERRVAEKEFLAVGTWTGEMCVPSFQFEMNGMADPKDLGDLAARVNKRILYMLSHTRSNYQGWPLTVFAYRHQDPDPADPDGVQDVQSRLEGTNEYEPGTDTVRPPKPQAVKATRCAFNVAARGPGVIHLEAGQKWYNAHPCCYPLDEKGPKPSLPYYFDANTADSKPLSGRFAINVRNRGTMYLAEDPLGSVKECLRHSPMLTLRELGFWMCQTSTVTHPRNSKVCSVVGLLEWTDISDAGRQVTQECAATVAHQSFGGIYYGLKQALGLRGLALFGPKGPHHTLPGWTSHSEPLINSTALWSYVETCKPDLDDMLLISFPPIKYTQLSLYTQIYANRPDFLDAVLSPMGISTGTADGDVTDDQYTELANYLG